MVGNRKLRKQTNAAAPLATMRGQCGWTMKWEIENLKNMKPIFRCGTGKAIDKLAEKLNLPNDLTMQDWSYTVGKSCEIEKYISLYDLTTDEDEKFVLMELIIQATEDQETEELFAKYWNRIKTILEKDFKIHEYTIYYWSCFDNENINDCWKITTFVRQIWNMNNPFEIKILKLHWIKEENPDDKEDLCLHGEVFIRIGDEVLSDLESGSWALSAAALFLLRTLKMDYKPDDFENLLIPCCGHFIIAEENKPVLVLGCPNGVDWTIKHIDGELVKHISGKGSEATITEEEYRKIVFDFADKVEQFYKDNPRILPKDEFDLEGYNGFWKEWKNLRN